MIITCCKNCTPPKRKLGCHDHCEEYKRQKAALNKVKQAEKDWKDQHPDHFFKFSRIF